MYDNYRVIDNFIEDDKYLDKVLETISSTGVPWKYVKDVVPPSTCVGMVHPMVEEKTGIKANSLYYLIEPVIAKIADEIPTDRKVIRSRLFRTFPTVNTNCRRPHTDIGIPNISTVWYLGDSDGSTVLYKGIEETPDGEGSSVDINSLEIITEVPHKHNRLLIFWGDQYHSSTAPTTHNERVILNTNFTLTKESEQAMYDLRAEYKAINH